MVRTCKATWFRKEGATSTIMVPFTKDSRLAKMVREAVQTAPGPRGCSVKVMERPGNKINLGLSMNDPFKRSECQREKCPIATEGKPCKCNCYKEGVVYQATCDLCGARYIGESGRTIYTRAGQHIADFEKARKQLKASGNPGTRREEIEETSSWLLDHLCEKHPQQIEDLDPWTGVKFKVLKEIRDPFSRQTEEACRIQEAINGKKSGAAAVEGQLQTLNRKGEYFCPRERWVRN